MKTKSNTSISTKFILCLSGVIFVLLFALRMYQRSVLTDPSDGFFTNKSNPSIIVFYIFSVVSVLAIVILAKLCSDLPSGVVKITKKPLQGIASLLFAVSLAEQTFRTISDITLIAKTNSVSFFQGAKLLGSYYYIAYFVFAFIGAIFMLVSAVSFLFGKNYVTKVKFLALSPVLWAFFLTINYFKINASYLKVTELMLTIFGSVFLMLFLFQYARFVSGIGSAQASWSFISTGLVSSILLLVTSLPSLIFIIAGKSELIIINCPFELFNLFGGIFSLVSVLTFMKSCVDKSEASEIIQIQTENEQANVSEPDNNEANNDYRG